MPLNLLQSQVAPGTATRLAWSPEDSFSGIASATPVLVVHGAKPGPRVCLAAAIHGDEVNGIEVVRHILYGIDPNLLSGSVIGVPIVNMQGFRRGSRYLSDRRDLNRYFPGHAKGSAAARLAASFFNEIVVHCNYLVDIHTGSLARTNLPQLRADLTKPSAVALAKSLGNIAVLHNKGAKGSLRRAALDRGIPAVTLEAGEPHTFQESAITQSVTSIEHLLNLLSMYTFSDLKPRRADAGFYRAQWVRATGGGMLFSRVNLGQEVKAGDLLGAVTDPITNQGFKVVAPRDGLIIGMALNQVIQPGFAIYHLGFPVSIQEAASSDAGPEDFGAEPAGEGEAY
jgi:predicted deacylase